jgi:formate/nitrite transporter FocA (FNT family)
MSVAPDPAEIYERAEREGQRRLHMSLLEQVSAGFIAGVTIVFGIVALAVTYAAVKPRLGADIANVLGALAFALGVVFLIVGRTELFSENFFDPVAAAIQERRQGPWLRLRLRLWLTILVLNLVGGAVLLGVLTVEGALPGSSKDALVTFAEEIAGKPWTGTFARAILAGALVTLLSYMLKAVDTVAARIMVAFLAGFFLAVGPFDHVVVSVLHLLVGKWLSDAVGYGDVLLNLGLSTLGNLLGGLLLITLTHTAQVKSR